MEGLDKGGHDPVLECRAIEEESVAGCGGDGSDGGGAAVVAMTSPPFISH